MNAELLNLGPADGILRRRAEVSKRRAAERAAAFEFLVTGETEGPAPDGTPWDRDYDPLPTWEALPGDLHAYDGTGIGALYGLPASRRFLWQLAGWNVVRRERP
jgi:hypothetical protein